MSDTRITINGQTYDSPDAMPPDVRRTYEEAMKLLGPAVAERSPAARTDVLAGHVGPFHGSVVVKHVVTMNGERFAGLEGMSPETRRLYDEAMRGAAEPARHADANVHLSLERKPSRNDRTGLQPVSDLESRIRAIPATIAVIVFVALIVWSFVSTR